MAKERELHLYLRAADRELWEWARQESARRRMSLSQFLAMLIEREQAATPSDG